MSEHNENNTAAESAEMTVDGANETGEVNVPVDKKNAAEGKESENTGVYVHKFKKPFEYEGTKYTTLNFYFERLTGRDMIAIEAEMQAHGEYALDPILSKSLQSKLAARAANIGADALEAMPMQEFNKITTAARNFLADSGY